MTKRKRVLVIHPKDRSTDFLCPIYAPVKNKTVIRESISKDLLIDYIKQHDRIMMMGHGCPVGLFNIGWEDFNGLIIDINMVPYLKDKDCVYIWCDADRFVNYHGLKGFYSGMFVSEISEAYWMGIKLKGREQYARNVKESNEKFSEIVSRHINKTVKGIYESVRQEYGLLAETNPIALYNNERLYLR
jgi:hypothetical protein